MKINPFLVVAGLIFLGTGGYMVAKYPRGIRNKNPGNIVDSNIAWRGKVGHDGRFVKFDNMENGVRALSIILINYYYKRGLVTIREIISRYAPSSENNTNAYINAVSNDVGLFPDQPMHKLEPYLSDMVKAIIKHENGRTVADYHIQKGVSLALQYKGLA